MFAMKDYLEAFDRSELSKPKEMGSTLKEGTGA